MRRRAIASTTLSLTVGVAATLSACSSSDDEPAGSDATLTIATVDNGDMIRMQELAAHFTTEHPDITIAFETMREGELRQQVTTDIATEAGRFDIVTLGPYETPLWAENEWLVPLDDLGDDYDIDDIIPSIRSSLSYEGSTYAVPFYGESSFTMYRTDLFDEAGIEMPEQPTWDDILAAAEQLDDPSGTRGMCLRGQAGWGENVALVTAMANSYGGRWFDQEWAPQLETEPWTQAVSTYVELGTYADAGSAELGYNENLDLFREGRCAIWVDSTAAASFVTAQDSQVADSVGFALAPNTGLDVGSNWLWAWALAIPESSTQQDAAREFVAWATSPEYTELVAEEFGWSNVPPGTRTSLYENQDYLAEAPFAPLVLQSLESADPDQPTVDDVPYTGIQYVTVPQFQGIGTAVGNQLAAALSGETPVPEALQNSQWVTEKVSERIRFTEEDS